MSGFANSIVGSFTMVRCEACGSTTDVRRVPALTNYPTKVPLDAADNPNRDRFFCPEHAAEYVEHWGDMWREYYAGRL